VEATIVAPQRLAEAPTMATQTSQALAAMWTSAGGATDNDSSLDDGGTTVLESEADDGGTGTGTESILELTKLYSGCIWQRTSESHRI
jgi:hypothetical protein